MEEGRDSRSPKPEAVGEHYASGYEAGRLRSNEGRLERERTHELFLRFLPPTPATILDVGGGPGEHACWLAKQGYRVHLIDIVPIHVEMAREASRAQAAANAPLASAEIGDARALSWKAGAAAAVLLLGPLYHLTDRAERLQALREAHRVLEPGGVLFAAGISRFASALDGLRRGFLKDPAFAEIVEEDLKSGQHRNHTGKPEYFTDTFFHTPDELRTEIQEAGFDLKGLFGLEGPCWMIHDFDSWWDHEDHRERLLRVARELETEPSIMGVSAHIIAVAGR